MIINEISIGADLGDVLNELRSQLTINHIHLVSSIKDGPDNIMVSCPYHKDGQERRPSAGIRKSDGVFHCFTCGETHSLPEVISYCFGKTTDVVGTFGFNWILKNFLTVSVEDRKPVDLNLSRINKIDKVQYVSEDELDSYRYFHPYMYHRRLTDNIIELFDIGYDKATECITFPIRDISGRTLFVARRSVKTKYFNYPNGVVKPLYGLYELHQNKVFPQDVIVCESMLDALSCWVYGKYAVALNGLGNDLQFEQLKDLPCRHLILATDNDNAGRSARRRIKSIIRNKLVTEYVLPSGKKDINELSKDEFLKLKEIF